MVHIRGEVAIDAPVEEVFDVVADERNEPKYNPRIAHAEQLTGGSIGKGSRFAAQPLGAGAKGVMTVEVLEYDRPHQLHNVIRSSYMQVDGMLHFSAQGDGTLMWWDWDMRLTGPSKFLTPVLALIGPRWECRNWEGLKRYIESGRR
ncbi:hypothetical protein ASG70_14310 [Phycicoccus sp. Soil748]|nr:hypothetical protein ASG70_14310 [Phycicoccus sp. Soil748]